MRKRRRKRGRGRERKKAKIRMHVRQIEGVGRVTDRQTESV